MNLLRAIINIAKYNSNDLKLYSTKYLNRINSSGEQLEFYFKDAIANTFTEPQKRQTEYSRVFSWLGNQNHPPDMIIKEGDAFEIKKIESPRSALSLNSSPPKDILRSNDFRLVKACRECEKNWKEKDLFYVLGNAKGGEISYLYIVQGTCYAANHETYDKIYSPLQKSVNTILDSLKLEKAHTQELGKIKRADPLGITELRIRGMWSIKNPLIVYPDIFKNKNEKKFHLFALLKSDKYNSFPRTDRKEIEAIKSIKIENVKIKDPNNPSILIDAKFIAWRQT